MIDGRPRTGVRYEARVLAITLIAGAIPVAVAVWLLHRNPVDPGWAWLATAGMVAVWLGGARLVQAQVVHPLRTLANLLGALREGDFSIRAPGARADDALGLAMLEVNTLSETLRDQRLGALEANALLRGVIAEIDVAVLAFDEEGLLRLVNRAGERLLGSTSGALLGRPARDLELDYLLQGGTPRTIAANFPGGSGRWELSRTSFRQGGLPHHLVVLSDLSRALREQERQAWQRLVRVLGHEINNSLAPIQSIAGSLADLVRQDPPPPDARQDIEQGLAVIRNRAGALARFMSSYARLARLPPPDRRPVDVAAWVRRSASLEARMEVAIRPGPPMSIPADGDQLDQLLINLIRNAVDASLETGGGVELAWESSDDFLLLSVIDEGPGIEDTANLFVPFFTTKRTGSGIGLALSRQIAEGHGGHLSLENRTDAQGCRAVLRMPL